MFKAIKALPIGAIVFVVLWVCMLLLLSHGCTGDPTVELQAQPQSTIPDVPVPSGFGLVEKQSRSRSRGNWRTVDYLYRGSENKFAVVRFVEKQMPAGGWQLMDKRFVQGRATMNFIKGNEVCVLSVYGDSGYSTYIHVDISPRGSMPAGNSPQTKKKR